MKKFQFNKARVFGLMTMALISLIILTNCKKSMNDSFDDTIAKYSVLGTMHEDGLDSIFERLKENYSHKLTTFDFAEIRRTVEAVSVDFTVKSFKFDQESKWQVKEIAKSYSGGSTKYEDDPNLLEMINDDLFLTSAQTFYLTKLNEIISGISQGVDYCISAIEMLEQEIYTGCPSSDQSLLFSATSIAKGSVNYWYENYYIWESEFLLNNPELTKTKEDRVWFWSALNRMGKADIAGGIWGGACGAAAGGVGAIPGALAGACTSSGLCGVVVLYDRLIN